MTDEKSIGLIGLNGRMVKVETEFKNQVKSVDSLEARMNNLSNRVDMILYSVLGVGGAIMVALVVQIFALLN